MVVPRDRVWLAAHGIQQSFTATGFESLAFLLGGNTLVRIHAGWRWYLFQGAEGQVANPVVQYPSLVGLIVTHGPDTVPEPPSATQGDAHWLHWEQLAFGNILGWFEGTDGTNHPTDAIYGPVEPHDRLDIEANRRVPDGEFGRLWMCWDTTAPTTEPPPTIRAEWWARMLVLV